jgi:flagellin
MAQLASGQRITKAADDAAGLAISENLRADLRSLQQAQRNSLDGVSLVQVAEGGLEETSNMLVRLRELAIQSASDPVGPTERGFIQKEYTALKDEIDRIANATEFNGIRLLVGDGANKPSNLPAGRDIGADQSPFEIQVGIEFLPDQDALESKMPVNIIRIELNGIDGYARGLGLGQSSDSDGTRVDSRDDAQMSIDRVDKAINKINDYRSYLGSVQNRLSNSIGNLGRHIENLSEAKSRIMDTDFASASADYTQTMILQRAGTSILAQSNDLPQVALELVRGG